MGCMPWFKPMTTIKNTNATLFTMPYAARASSPPYSCILRFRSRTTRHEQAFIRKGDMPMASVCLTMLAFSL